MNVVLKCTNIAKVTHILCRVDLYLPQTRIGHALRQDTRGRQQLNLLLPAKCGQSSDRKISFYVRNFAYIPTLWAVFVKFKFELSADTWKLLKASHDGVKTHQQVKILRKKRVKFGNNAPKRRSSVRGHSQKSNHKTKTRFTAQTKNLVSTSCFLSKRRRYF